MNEKTIVSMSLSEALLQRDEGRTDWDRLRREEQAGIEPKSDPDEGEFDEAGGRFIERHRKQAISVRLDQDVLEFFKSGGPGYQTRMNAVLRSYMHDCHAAARVKKDEFGQAHNALAEPSGV